LLRAREKLAEMPEKQARLNDLLAINETLHRVYLLKEDLRLFWKQRSKKEARKFVEEWIEESRAMGNPHVTKFANTVEKHIDPILAWYDHSIATGPLEGLNNKIKVLKRAAYGYRDTSFFALSLLFIHETAFNLSGA
jgi:transposase